MNEEGIQQFDPDKTMSGARGRRERGELQVGDVVLNRYELLEKLGSGVMGIVFKCRDQVSHVEYALKTVPPELVLDAEAMEDVLENFQLVHGLKHPNIAGVDFLDRDELGSFFLIMEYAPGITLSQWIKQKWRNGKPELGEVAGIVKQIAAALDFAHSQHILHRDIKPTNIMVAGNGQVKVLDFGLASKVRNTLTAMSINPANTSGTPSYLAPEQFKGRYPTPAADQYALGVLAYQMLSGHLPFDSDDYNVLRSAVVNEAPEEIEGLPEEVNQSLLRVLNKDPKLRYASCIEFADELANPNRMEKPAEKKIITRGHDDHAERNKLVEEQNRENPENLYQKGMTDYNQGNSASAVEAFRKAAEQGHSAAQFSLGYCCLYGHGVTRDYAETVKWFRKGAERGHADAQCWLGECYYNGIGVGKNVVEAVKWFRKAAEQGHTRGQILLGNCYCSGIEGNKADAVVWFRKAAEQSDPVAQYMLGNCYKNGQGVNTDELEAVKWYQKAAEQGNASAQCALGECFYFGSGVDRDYVEAVNWFRKAAEPDNSVLDRVVLGEGVLSDRIEGNDRAKFMLGECYYNGLGVNKDPKEAVKWYRKAMKQGNADAQFALGNCYYSGNGVSQDPDEALKWYHKAAEQGHAAAQYTLAEKYYLKEDDANAVKWYRKAAEQGHADAQYELAECYNNGLGIDKDNAEAVKWYRNAAEQGHAAAQYELAECYRVGLLVGTDEDKAEYEAWAAEWYRKAAEQGYVAAQYMVGKCYDNGFGIDEDKVEALKWYREAAEHGHADAQYRLGVCYYTGNSVTIDYAEAVKWFREAAGQGHFEAMSHLEIAELLSNAQNGDAESQYKLANAYETGEGLKQDYVEAAKWYRKVAEQGNVVAQYVLGKLYKNGKGVKQDYAEAAKWYRKAAEQGYPDAQQDLGTLYKNGKGVKQDYAEAGKWFRKAADQGKVYQLCTKKDALILALALNVNLIYCGLNVLIFVLAYILLVTSDSITSILHSIVLLSTVALFLAISCLVLFVLIGKTMRWGESPGIFWAIISDQFFTPMIFILGYGIAIGCLMHPFSFWPLLFAVILCIVIYPWFFFDERKEIKRVLEEAGIKTKLLGVPWSIAIQLWKDRNSLI